jgi:lipid-A-disaccharide synthase
VKRDPVAADHQAEIARTMIAEHQRKTNDQLDIEVHTGRTTELIHAATCCMAVSGSVSLELLYHAKPTVVLYWISRVAYFVQSYFRRVKYITLVNLLTTDELFPRDTTPFDPNQPDADRVLFPEYLTYEDKCAKSPPMSSSGSGNATQRRIAS